MKVLEAFQIPIIALEDKSYQYSFQGDDTFFAAFEQDWVEKGHFSSIHSFHGFMTSSKIEGLSSDDLNRDLPFPSIVVFFRLMNNISSQI